ncbi:MAG TPA: cytochrome b N-terminal domain-containing protein [Candidatus Eisenbacteria bacterium]|jgi:quinol-cytochrome oxidoreductase complex cytochrome b subunit
MSEEPVTPARSFGDRLLDALERRLDLSELFSFLSHFGLVMVPLDTRRPLRELLRDLDATPVPEYVRGRQALGVLMAVLFAIEAVTGMLLAFHYRPTPDAAHTSTLTIVRDLPLGGVIHQVHTWGALALILVVVLRLLRLFWDGLWKAPREVLWCSAVALVWLSLQFDFTGRLLTWDARGYWSTVRGIEVVYSLPIVGPVLAFLLGGRVMGEDVLTRFYALHVGVLPLLWVGCLYLTFATVRRVGLGSYPSMPAIARTSTFRRHRYNLLLLALFLFAGLVTLAVLVPFRFNGPADPYVTPAGARPPWYMHAAYLVIQRSPVGSSVAGAVLLVFAFGLLLLPWWAPRVSGALPEKRLRMAGVAIFVAWLALSVLGTFLDRG